MMIIKQSFNVKTDIKVNQKQTVYKQFFQIESYQLQHKKFDGSWTKELTREVAERGDAVAVLLHDPIQKKIVLLEQFRVGAYARKDDPWLLECVAGMAKPEENKIKVAKREVQEETGITVLSIEHFLTYYSSPGGMSEQIHLFYATINSDDVQPGIYGLANEQEDIRTHLVEENQVFTWLNNGQINNAATIIALQWLLLRQQIKDKK